MKILKAILKSESLNEQEQERSALNEKLFAAVSKLKADKKLLMIALLSAGAVLLILLSKAFDFVGSKEKPAIELTSSVSDSENYEKNIEDRLTEIISSIDGAGKTSVMVTLESGEKQVYASDSKNGSEQSVEKGGDYEQKNDAENKPVVVESDGKKTGLVVKVIQPEIRGVAVVCEGADLSRVQRDITKTVTAVLGISSARVSVTKMTASYQGN